MDFTILIENRINIGFQVGFAFYKADEEYPENAFHLHLGLIAIIFIYEKTNK